MKLKAEIMDGQTMGRSLVRVSHEILERNNGLSNLALVGIHTRGVPMAKRIAENIRRIEGKAVPVGTIDITLYRDDLTTVAELPQVTATAIDFDITGKDVVLCDDVIFTGRTVRAAIDALFQRGRPKTVQLAVCVDRGHRELPIRADYVVKNVPTSLSEVIAVKFTETDGQEGVSLYSME